MTATALDAVAARHLGDARGDHRAACPVCAKAGRDDAVSITVNTDGSVVAHCHRCGENGTAKPDRVNGARRPAARVRPTPPREDFRALRESGVEPGEACEHGYLQRKQVGMHGIRIASDMLLVPMRNETGELVGVQKIAPDKRFVGGTKDKLYVEGSRKKGAYHLIGELHDKIVVAEGYATAGSIFEATGVATVVAFDAGNLIHVAQTFRGKYPKLEIIIAGDDDNATDGNPGMTKATEAARAVGGLLAVPGFGADRPEDASDFNDLSVHRGAEAVRLCVAAAQPVRADEQADHDDDDRVSLRPRSVPELLRRETPRWIVRGLIADRSIIVIFGASGSGKTFIVLDMACSIARRIRWMGRRVRQGGVVYVAAEGHLRLRLLAYLQHHGLDTDALERLRVVTAPINLLTAGSGDLDTLVVEIKAAAAELGGVVLVVLDTLNAMMPGGNENASEDMGAMIAAARRIVESIGCAVVFVHHSGKDESKGSRGHSSLKAAVDLEMQVTGDGDRVIEAVKVRDGEPGQQFGFRLHPFDLGPDDDPEAEAGERLSSCVVVPLSGIPAKPKPKVRRDVALDALHEAISEFGDRLPSSSTIPPGVKAVTLTEWRDRWALRTGYDDSKGESVRVNFDKDRRALLTAGAIEISKPYVWLA